VNALEIQQLRKTYSSGFVALQGIDLTVEPGDFFALLGPNGAGKSTTIGIITGLVTKSSGKVSVFGRDIDVNPEDARSFIGLVPQEINFSQFETVLDIVVNQAGFYGVALRLAQKRAKKYLSALDLWTRRHHRSRTLSGGMKRRLMIARALLHEPQLLILDEPTAGVDIELRRSMWEFLRAINRAGTTIILTTHYLEEAENLCRNIAIIDHGNIVTNTSIKSLLSKLNTETFVFDLKRGVQSAPAIDGCRATLVDEHTLEIEVPRERGLNHVFSSLGNAGIEISSMRNKANRLEELFLSIVRDSNATPAASFQSARR
jgi:ABC-2 type transport system ATP-binding protein